MDLNGVRFAMPISSNDRWTGPESLFARSREIDWPDSLDLTILVLYLAIGIAIPLTGYLLMFVDIRAYLRSLRRALVRVAYHFPTIPEWARNETPACLRALGLRLPCTTEDVKRAYRRLAYERHPDRGGRPREFSKLHRDFEAAMRFVDERTPPSASPSKDEN